MKKGEDLRAFVERRLAEMHARPSMWVGSKEALALQLVLLVELVSDEDFKPVRLLSKLFPDSCAVPHECLFAGEDDSEGNAWARNAIDIARKELPAATVTKESV